jgi:hypothetical protein
MKTFPLPLPVATRLKLAYDALMRDDLPIDFDKVSELIQASGEIVRSYELTTASRPRMRVVKVAGQRFVKQYAD